MGLLQSVLDINDDINSRVHKKPKRLDTLKPKITENLNTKSKSDSGKLKSTKNRFGSKTESLKNPFRPRLLLDRCHQLIPFQYKMASSIQLRPTKNYEMKKFVTSCSKVIVDEGSPKKVQKPRRARKKSSVQYSDSSSSTTDDDDITRRRHELFCKFRQNTHRKLKVSQIQKGVTNSNSDERIKGRPWYDHHITGDAKKALNELVHKKAVSQPIKNTSKQKFGKMVKFMNDAIAEGALKSHSRKVRKSAPTKKLVNENVKKIKVDVTQERPKRASEIHQNSVNERIRPVIINTRDVKSPDTILKPEPKIPKKFYVTAAVGRPKTPRHILLKSMKRTLRNSKKPKTDLEFEAEESPFKNENMRTILQASFSRTSTESIARNTEEQLTFEKIKNTEKTNQKLFQWTNLDIRKTTINQKPIEPELPIHLNPKIAKEKLPHFAICQKSRLSLKESEVTKNLERIDELEIMENFEPNTKLTQPEDTEGVSTTSINKPVIEKQSILDCTNSAKTKKACMAYTRTAQQALALLNAEASSALRDSFFSINDICLRVRRTVDEINESDQMYQRLKQYELTSQSTPHLAEECSQNVSESQSLLHALSLGLVQTQSENQVRLAVFPTTSITELPEATASEQEMQPILPKIVPIVEPTNPPCTVLKQQNKIFNIPPNISLQTESNPELKQTCPFNKQKVINTFCNKKQEEPLKQKHFFLKLPPEIKQRLKAIADKLDLSNLPRSKAQLNLYLRLIKEFMATDSLVEFQRQMKHYKTKALEVKKTQGKEATGVNIKDEKETKGTNSSKKKLLHLTAEELFVPSRKINKIAPTNLNATWKNKSSPLRLRLKTCQFLYREMNKKKERKSRPKSRDMGSTSSKTIQLPKKPSTTKELQNDKMQQKYPGSLWFSSTGSKKVLKQSKESCLFNSTSASSNRCTIVENTVHTQTEKLQEAQAPWNMPLVNYKVGLDCFDILDEITLKDVKPLESEYPRKDHIGSEHFHKVENTFLYKLVYNATQNQFLQLLRLEEPSLFCTKPQCEVCSTQNERKTNEPNTNTSGSSTAQNKSPEPSSSADDNQHPARIHDKHHKSDTHSKQKQSNTEKKRKSKKKKAKDDIAEKLRPYIFDPQMRYPTTITVMPVTVTTTYTNPNYGHHTKPPKDQSGDFLMPVLNKTNKFDEARDKVSNRLKSKTEKKTWSSKYSKTPSCNLMSYLEKQNHENPHHKTDHWDESLPETVKQSPITSPKIVKKGINSQSQPNSPHSHLSRQIINLPKPPRKSYSPTKQMSMAKDVQKPSGKTSLEKNIQHVIDTIEQKIVDIISSPEKAHSETFNSVEKEIVNILNVIKTDNANPLEAINEGSDTKPETEDSDAQNTTTKMKNRKKKKFYSKTTSNLYKNNRNNPQIGTESQLSGALTTETSQDATDYLSSTEERFVVTSSYAPKQALAKNEQETQGKSKEPVKCTSEVSIKTVEQIVPHMDKQPKEVKSQPGSVKNTKQKTDELKNNNTDLVIEESGKSELLNEEIPKNNIIEQLGHIQLKVHEGPKKDNIKLNINKPKSADGTRDIQEKEITNENVTEHVTLGNELNLNDKPNNTDEMNQQACLEIGINLKTHKEVYKIENQPAILSIDAHKVDQSTPEENKQIQKSVEKQDKVICELKKSEITTVAEVKSDVFLTPFMQALRRYRHEDRVTSAYNILEFLDTLTSISEDIPKTVPANKLHIVNYYHKVHVTHAFEQPEIFYPITIHHPIIITTSSSKQLKVLFESRSFPRSTKQTIVENLIEHTSWLSSLDLFKKFVGLSKLPLMINKVGPTDKVCCCVHKILDQSITRKDPLEALFKSQDIFEGKQTEIIRNSTTTITYTDDHATFLNSLYGMLFVAIFLSLAINYTCQ